MPQALHWKDSGLPEDLVRALSTLAEEYPLVRGEGLPAIEFRPGGEEGALRMRRSGDVTTIEFGSLSAALRGVGAALAGLPRDGETLSEQTPFSSLGIMLDCSRNAVMKVEHLKKWLRRLALFGYNLLMLYTEDTYKLPDEPLFGFLRGAYSPEELREIDDYAASLGIETVGCIQTLGHLEQILKWQVYADIKDTSSVMLVDEDKTYELIRKMVANFSRCLRSRRIHVGMDETHDLGRGRFLDLHGFERGFDIFNRHLGKVIEICAENGMRPMIWSDMYFRLGSKTGTYYDPEAVIPQDVIDAIPKGADLVYWDYYHTAEAEYLDMIERHRKMGREPVMASGVWTWTRLWYDRRITEGTVGPCVSACRKAGLKEIFFTMWGDDGAYCEYDSALSGLAWAAEKCWSEDPGDGTAPERFSAACGIDYSTVLLGCAIEDPSLGESIEPTRAIPASNILWDDPLYGIHHLTAADTGVWEKVRDHLAAAAEAMENAGDVQEPADLAHGAGLASFLAAKIDFRLRLEKAFRSSDNSTLLSLAEEAELLAQRTETLLASFRRQWHRRNKPFGFETIQIRLGGLRERFLETSRAVRDLAEGRRDTIDELAEGLAAPRETLENLRIGHRFHTTALPTSIL